jgi:hypothetical protein
LVEISAEALRLFGDERWSRGKKNRSTGDNNDESMRAGARETDEGERPEGMRDRMPSVLPPTCDRGPLKTLREIREFPFFLTRVNE